MDAPIEFCKNHKPEFYEKVESGQYVHVPGIDEEFETPVNPDLYLTPDDEAGNLEKIASYLEQNLIYPIG